MDEVHVDRPEPEDPEARERRERRNAGVAMIAILAGFLIVGIPAAIFLYRLAFGMV